MSLRVRGQGANGFQWKHILHKKCSQTKICKKKKKMQLQKYVICDISSFKPHVKLFYICQQSIFTMISQSLERFSSLS